MGDAKLHEHARKEAEKLLDPDRKQLRFNEIVSAAKRFYPSDPMAGVSELVQSCDRSCSELYVKGAPMWKVLEEDYAWLK